MNPSTYIREERSEYYSFLNYENRLQSHDKPNRFEGDEQTASLSIPTFNFYLELMLWQIFNEISNSVDQFYQVVFEERSMEQIYDNELIEGVSHSCSMDVLKEYYQQFCYWSLLDEEDIYSQSNIRRLHKKGHKIVEMDEEVPILKKVLLKVNINKSAISEISLKDYKSSLHAFVELICIQTYYDADEVSLDIFNEHYELFCNLFELELTGVDPVYLKREFNIESVKKKATQVIREGKPSDVNPKEKSAKFYQLNLVRVSEYLSLLKGQGFSERISNKEKNYLARSLVFPKHWYVLDILLGLSLYLIFFVLNFFYAEHGESFAIMLSHFKRIPEIFRLRDFNSVSMDGEITFDSYYTEPIQTVLFLRAIFFYLPLGVSVVAVIAGKDIFNYYNTSKNKFMNWSNDIVAIIQWLLLLGSAAAFIWSISLYIIGSIIYSLTKIYALLPFVVATMCFAFYIWYYWYNAKKKVYQIEKEIREDLRTLLTSRYIERLRHASSYNSEMLRLEQLRETNNKFSKDGSNEPLTEEELRFTISQVMDELKEVCMLPDNWRLFIESVLLRDKQKIQTSLIEIVEHKPLSLPQGSLELLNQILSMDEHMESPDQFITSLSSILVKIMMTNEKTFLKDLKLKELETLKACGCRDETLLDKNLVCRNCANPIAYTKNHNEIFRVTLEKNTYIFLLLLSLMDLLRKKKTGQILEILIEKILPEGLQGNDKNYTSCLMRLAYLAFFDLDQHFSRIDWAKCINDVLLNFFENDQNSLQLINLLEEGHNDNAFDLNMNFIESTDTINAVKRCITSGQQMLRQTNCISLFMAIVTVFLGKESAVPEKLLNDILQFINKNSNIQISIQTLRIIFNYLLFSRETPKSIFDKISLNAQKYFLDKSVSETIKEIKSIASGISKDIKTRDYQNLENSELVSQIRKALALQPYEMMGLVYLVNDKPDNDEVNKFFYYLLTLSNNLKYEKILVDLISLALSKDLFKISKAFERLKLKYQRIFEVLRGLTSFNSLQLDAKSKYVADLIGELSIDYSQVEEAKFLFVRCLEKKDLSTFFQTVGPKGDISIENNLENPKWRNLKMLELIWTLNSDEKLTEVLIKFKFLFRELDDPLFYTFAIKIYTVLEYLAKRNKNQADSTTSKNKAIKVLSDLLLTKTENVKKFLELFVSERSDDFLDAFCYFDEVCREIREKDGKSLKNHVHYIDKSIKFLQAQIEFYSSNPVDPIIRHQNSDPSWRDYKKPGEDDLGVIITKKVMMPEVKLQYNQIMLLLESIVGKIFNSDDKMASRQVRIMKFFTTLFVYVLGDQTSDLGDYFFQDHGEGFIKTLINCRGSKSAPQRINSFFEDLFHKRSHFLGNTLYIYLTLFLRKKLNRDEFNLKETFESKLAVDLELHKEIFDFLDVYIHKDRLKFKSMLMSVHWKILKQSNTQNSLKKEDLDWGKLYENILSVMADKQPNLTFFSDLLRVPYSKLNFVYILNNLRNSAKVDKVLQEANSSSSFKEIVESINIDHSELVQILKICLNKEGFECLDVLLKKMNLQDQNQIDISLLMNLLTIDAQLTIDSEETRVLVKRMNLYSSLFKKMKIDKDLAWAFIRILKGDMYSFKKLMTAVDNEVPLHHNRFLNIVAALCGCKNSPYTTFNRESYITVREVLEKYSALASDHRKKKENSKEAAQIMIWEQLSIHPMWSLLENQVGLKVQALVSSQIIRVFNLKEPKCPLTMFHVHILQSILNMSLESLEIFVNLSFFHNITTALNSLRVVSGVKPQLDKNLSKEEQAEAEKEAQRLADSAAQSLDNLYKYFKNKFDNLKARFRDAILKDYVIDFEYSKNLTDIWMFLDQISQDSEQDLNTTFYSMINNVLISNWEQTSMRNRSSKMSSSSNEEEQFKKLTKEFEKRSIYEAFESSKHRHPEGTQKKAKFNLNNSGKDLGNDSLDNAYFKDPARYDEFLDSTVDCILSKMKELNMIMMNQKISLGNFLNESRADLEEDENSYEYEKRSNEDESSAGINPVPGSQQGQDEDYNRSVHSDGRDLYEDSIDQEHNPEDLRADGDTTPQRKFVSNGIIEFCLHVSLKRLRRNITARYEEKIKEADAEFTKIDMVFTTLEKIAMFSKNLDGFHKFKYMTLFSFSQGNIINWQKHYKPKYSLFAPELVLLSQLESEKYARVNFQGDFEYPFEIKEFLGRMHMIKRVLDHDLVNLSSQTPFPYYCFTLRQIHNQYPKTVPKNNDPSKAQYYFGPCLLKKPIYNRESLMNLTSESDYLPFCNSILSGFLVNPVDISFKMLSLGLFKFNTDPYIWNSALQRLDFNEKIVPLTDQTTLEEKVEKLKLTFQTKIGVSKQPIDEQDKMNPYKSDFDKMLDKLMGKHFLLNDLAHGHYKVLSETRNIFSDKVQYSRYQRIYEAILRLHHLAVRYDENGLRESLEILAPCLSSDKNKICLIIDYILNPNKDSSRSSPHPSHFKDIGKDLDFQNNQITDLLFLFNNDKSTIISWVHNYLGSLALPENYTRLIENLLTMYLKIVSDKNQAWDFKAYKPVYDFLMNPNANNNEAKIKFCQTVERIISHIDYRGVYQESSMQAEVTNLYAYMSALLTRKKTPMLANIEDSESILNLALDVIDKKFKILNNMTEEMEERLKVHFGVNNTNLLNIFKLIEWLTNPTDFTSDTDIEKHFFEFLNYGNFELMNLNIEKIKLVLHFLKNFNKADVEGILQFLRDLQLTKEYVYIFSRYIWITTLNRNFIHEKQIEVKLSNSVSVLNWYPFFDIIYYEAAYHQPSLQQNAAEIKKLHHRLMVSISKIPYEKVFRIVDKNLDRYTPSKLLAFLKGESFEVFLPYISSHLSAFSDPSRYPDLQLLMSKLANLFFFSTKFFIEEDPNSPVSRNKNSLAQNYDLDAFIDYSINIFLRLMEYQGQNQEFVKELFSSQQQFNLSAIRLKFDKFEELISKRGIHPISFAENPAKREIELNSWEHIFVAGKYLWFIKYYVLQIKHCKHTKIEDSKLQYQKIFIRNFEFFVNKVIEHKKLILDQAMNKKSILERQRTMREREIRRADSRINPEVEKKRREFEEITKGGFKKMMTRMINLFLNMKFKRNQNSVFQDLVDFLLKDVFKSPDKSDRLMEFVKKINIESFFELYDNIYENTNIFNRNAENILRLALNTFKGFTFKAISKTAPKLVKVCRGSISDFEDLLNEFKFGNDKVALAMNQIRWCDNLIKTNNHRKRVSDYRRLHSRLKNSGNARILNEMSMTDQLVFINSLKTKYNMFMEVVPFFEAHLSSDASYYTKYDLFKLLKRMGFEMSIHRLNEIVTESIDRSRKAINISDSTHPNTLTREELKHCLITIEKRVVQRVVEMKGANLSKILFYGVVSSILAYFTIRIYMILIKNVWQSNSYTDAYVACIPVIVLIMVIAILFQQPKSHSKDTQEQVRVACTMLFTNFN